MSKEAKSAESVKDSNKKKAFSTKSINPMKNVVGGMKGGLSSWWQNFKENLPKQLIKFGLILGGFIIVLIIISLSFSSKRGKCFEADTFDDGEFGYIINANGRNGKTEEEKSLEMDKNTYIHEETTQRMKKVNFNLKKDNKPIIIDIKDHWIPWFGDIDLNRSEEDINSSTPSKLVLCPMKKQVIPEFFSDNKPIMGSLKEENEFQYIDSYYSDFRFKEESETEIKKITTLRNPLLQEPCWLTGGLGLYMGFYGTSGKKQPGYFHHLQANQMVCNAYDFLPSNSTFLSNYSKIIKLADNLNMNLVNLDGGKKYLLKDFIKENFSVKYFKNKDSIYQACFNNKITNEACSDSCTKEANAEFEKTEKVEKEKIFNDKLKEYNNVNNAAKQDFLSTYKNYLDYESLSCLYEEKEKKLKECIYENKTEDIENLINSDINYLPPIVNEDGTTTPQTSTTKGAELNRLKVRYDFYIRTQKKHTSSEKIAFSEMELKLFKNWSYFKDVFDLISLDKEEEKEKEGETEEQKQERINTLKINKLKKYLDSLQSLKADNTKCQESNKVDEEINDILSIGNLCYDEKNYEALVEALDSKTQAIVSEKFLSCITSKCSSSNNKLVILKNKISQSLSTCVDKYQKILKEIHTRNTEHINILNQLNTVEINKLKNFNLEVEGLMKNEDAIIEQCNKIEQLYFIDLDNELIQMADRRTVLQEQININQKLLKVNMGLIKSFVEDGSSINNFKAKNILINAELVKIKKTYQDEINTYKIKYPGIEIDYVQYKSQQGTYFKNSIKTIQEYSKLINLEDSVDYVKTEIAKIVEIAEKLIVGKSIDGADPKDYNIVAVYNAITKFKNDIEEFNADPIYIKGKSDEIKKTHIKKRIVQKEPEDTIEKLPELENELLELSQKTNAMLKDKNFRTITDKMEIDINSFFDEILSYLNSHINIIKNDTVPLLSVYLDNLKNFKELDLSLKADVEDYYRYSLFHRYHIFKGSFNLSSTISGIYHSGRDKEAPYLEQIQDDIKLILNTYGKKENSAKIYTNTKNVETGDVLAFKDSFELSPMFSNLYKITNAIDKNCIYDFNTVGIEFSKYVMKNIDRTIRFADFINYGKDFFNLFFADQQFYGTKECNGVSGNNQKCQVLTFTNSICDNTSFAVPTKFSQSTDASIKKVFEQNALRGLKFPITKVEKSTDSKISQKDMNGEFSLFNLFIKDLDSGDNSPIKNIIKNVNNANSDVKTNYTNSKCVNQNDQDLMACCIRTKEDEINKDTDIGQFFLQNNSSENTVIYDMERHEQALIAGNVKNIPQILVKAQNSFYNACYKESTIKKDNGEKGQLKDYLSFYRYSEKTKMFPILKTYNYNSNKDTYEGENYSLGEIPFFIILDKYYDDNQGSYNLNFKSGFSLSSSAFGGKLKNELLKIEYKLLGTSRPEQEKFDRTDGVVYHVYQRIITDSFRNLAKAILALFVIIKGYYIIFGLTQINIKELMILTLKIAFLFSIIDKNGWNFYNKTFINFFINSTIGFIDLLYIIFYKIFDDQNNLQAFISNTNILAANGNELNLSKYFIFLDNLIETILSESFFARMLSLIFYKMPFGIIFMIILVKSTISYLNSVITMVINYISILLQIAILLPLAPIFLLFMLFKQTFPYFKNWVSYLMSRCIELIAFFFVIFFSVSLINGQLNEVLNFKTCVDTVYSSSKNVKNAVFTESDLTGMQGRSVFISGLITMMSGLAMAIFGGVVFYIPVGLIESEVTLFEFMLRMLKLYFLLTMFGQINTTVTNVITQIFKFKIDPKDDRDKGGYRSNTAGQIGGQGGFLGALGNQTGLDSEGQGGGLLGSLGMGGVLRTPSVGGAMKVGKVAGTHMKNLATAALRTFGVGNGSLDALTERIDDSRRNNKAKRVRRKQAKQALLASYVGKAVNLQEYADRRNRYKHNQWRLFKDSALRVVTFGRKGFSKQEREIMKSMNAEHRKYTRVLAKTLNQTLGLGIFQIKRQLKTLSKPEALKLKQEVAQKSAEEKLKKLDQDRINMENNKYKFEFLDNKSGKEGRVIKSMVVTNDSGENIIIKMVNGQMVISINNDTYTLNKDGIFVNSAGVALDLFNMDNVKVAKNLIDYGRRFIEAKRVGIDTLNTTSEVKHSIKQGNRRMRLSKTEQTLNKAVDNLVQKAKDNDDKAFKLVKTEHSLNNATENLAENHKNKKSKLNKTEYNFEIHTNDKKLHYDNNNLLIDENGVQLNLNNQENIDLIREVNKKLVIEQIEAENNNYKSKDIFSDYQPKDIENKIENLIDTNTKLVASKIAGLEFIEKQEQLAIEQGQNGLDVQYNMIMKGDITEMTITAGMENFKISSNGKDFSISSDIGNFTLNSEGQYLDENQQPMSENEANTLKVMEKMTKMSEKFLEYQKMLLTKLEEENANPKIIKLKKEEIEKQSESVKKSENRQKRLKNQNENN